MPSTHYIVKKSGRSMKTDAAWLGGELVEFRRATIKGHCLMVAAVDADSPAVETARKLPKAYGVLEADPETIEYEELRGMAPTGDAPKRKSADMLPAPVRAALQNGWSREDVEGTCQHGRPGPEGGRSPSTGLTAVEMALSSPPEDWNERRAEMWPWEDLTWRGPASIGWRPPNMPPRLRSLVEDAPEEETVEAPPEELVTRVGAVEVARTPGEDGEYGTDDDEIQIRKAPALVAEEGDVGIDDDGDEIPIPVGAPVYEMDDPEPEPEPEDEPADIPPDAPVLPLDHEDNAVLLTYSDDVPTIMAAAALIADLERKSAAAPSVSKANYHLRKADLPTCNARKLDALLRTPVVV